MGFANSTCSFTRFRILDPVSSELWQQIPDKLKQFAFRDIDDTLKAGSGLGQLWRICWIRNGPPHRLRKELISSFPCAWTRGASRRAW